MFRHELLRLDELCGLNHYTDVDRLLELLAELIENSRAYFIGGMRYRWRPRKTEWAPGIYKIWSWVKRGQEYVHYPQVPEDDVWLTMVHAKTRVFSWAHEVGIKQDFWKQLEDLEEYYVRPRYPITT